MREESSRDQWVQVDTLEWLPSLVYSQEIQVLIFKTNTFTKASGRHQAIGNHSKSGWEQVQPSILASPVKSSNTCQHGLMTTTMRIDSRLVSEFRTGRKCVGVDYTYDLRVQTHHTVTNSARELL